MRRGAIVLALLAVFVTSTDPSFADEHWVEIRTPNFTVVSNAGTSRARGIALELEQICQVFRVALPDIRRELGQPVIAFAVKDERGLEELLPQFWEQKSSARPAGAFMRTVGAFYIVLRADLPREQRYRAIYHEYFHLLHSLAAETPPVWFHEGLASFWERTEIGDERIKMGLPHEDHLDALRRRNGVPIPLRELVTRGQNAHLEEGDRAVLFYAESWALTHMLLLGKDAERMRPALVSYLRAYDSGADSLEAFEQSFGPVEEVENQLRRYVFRKRMSGMRMKAPPKVEADAFELRELAPGESEAMRAGFVVFGPRPRNAIPLVERALALNPGSARAMETLGFYYFRDESWDEAESWYRRATLQQSPGFLAHYFYALVVLRKDGQAEQAVDHLKKSLAQNPRFAPAHAHLGRLYAARGASMEDAYSLAREAVRLDPHETWHWVNLGRILLGMGRLTGAAQVEERARRLARSPREEKLLRSLAADIERHRRRAASKSDVVQNR